MFFNTLTKKIEAYFGLLFDGLAYNLSGHFGHCSYFSSPLWGSENTTQLAKYLHVLYAEPLNKMCVFTIVRWRKYWIS